MIALIDLEREIDGTLLKDVVGISVGALITERDCPLGSEQLAPTSSQLSDCCSISDDDASEVAEEIISTTRRSDYECIIVD